VHSVIKSDAGAEFTLLETAPWLRAFNGQYHSFHLVLDKVERRDNAAFHHVRAHRAWTMNNAQRRSIFYPVWGLTSGVQILYADCPMARDDAQRLALHRADLAMMAGGSLVSRGWPRR